MARTIALVLDPAYGERLEKLAFRSAVWIVESEVNRLAAEEAWRLSDQWPQISVTVFRDPGPDTPREYWAGLLEQIALHEGALSRTRPYDTVEAIGGPLTPSFRAALEEAGFTTLTDTEAGFRAKR
jgi:hypothetical protein